MDIRKNHRDRRLAAVSKALCAAGFLFLFCLIMFFYGMAFENSGTVIAVPDISKAMEANGANLLSAAADSALSTGLARRNGVTYLLANVPGAAPVFSDNDITVEYAALVITCLETPEPVSENDTSSGVSVSKPVTRGGWRASVSVDGSVIPENINAMPATLELRSDLFDSNQNIPFKAGRRYLAACVVNRSDAGVSHLSIPYSAYGNFLYEIGDFDAETGQTRYMACLPPAPEHEVFTPWVEIERTWNRYSAQSEEVNAILDFCGLRTGLIPVIATDGLNNILQFQQGEAVVTKGRGFTDDEIENGSRVCVISENMSTENGLSVGGYLSMRLTWSTFGETENDAAYAYGATAHNAFFDNGGYKIVGIYKNSGAGNFNFVPDSIYIARTSISNPPENDIRYIDDVVPPEAYSYILRSDRLNALKSAMEANGADHGLFIFHAPVFKIFGYFYRLIKIALPVSSVMLLSAGVLYFVVRARKG